MSNSEPHNANQEGSKFKRFLKRFGRRPSEENRRAGEEDEEDVVNDEDAHKAAGSATNPASGAISGSAEPAGNTKKSGSMRSRKGSKNGGVVVGATTSTKGKKSDSLAGRFFQTSATAPPIPSSPQLQQQKNGASTGTTTTNNTTTSTSPAIPMSTTTANAFGGTTAEGLADTLTIPPDGSPAPRLKGLPRHEPIATGDLIIPSADKKDTTTYKSKDDDVVGEVHSSDPAKDGSSLTAAGDHQNDLNHHTSSRGVDEMFRQSSFGSSPSQDRRQNSSDIDSAEGGIRGRDSLDNRTVDTSKSRASTKPTTLMSLDGVENTNGSYGTVAQIAQHRHGDATTTTSNRIGSTRGNESEGGVYSNSSIQFAPQAPLGRTISGTIVQLPGSVEDIPYMNVPSVSRPHPSNNPMPSGLPADNASVLTLASSTAAASIGGGAASSRGGHSHATPSLGGARSIGGSLMGDLGERRNSSDTYASVKALPPMSRRGSDSSSRTGKSVAASATGLSSAQAMMGAGAAATIAAGPGAPYDRISLHRTASQRTIATQLSIPISTSNQVITQESSAIQATPSSTLTTETAISGTSIVPSITTTGPHPQQFEQHESVVKEALKAHVDQLAAA